MDKKEILDILDNAKDDRGAVPMRLVRQALDKLSAIQPISSVQPKPDCVSRQAAIDALARMMPRSYTPDGSHPADEEIFRAQEVFADCIEALEILPSAQPATSCSEIPNGSDDTISRQAAIDAVIDEFKRSPTPAIRAKLRLEALPPAQPEQRWIPVTERLPENDNEVLITVWDAEDDYVEVYKGFYQGHEWWTQWCHGCSKIKDEPCGENIVIAWKPLPEPYRGGDSNE